MPLLKQEKLTAFNPQNFHQYKEEVTAGVYEDWKRDTVDNAKKRAVTQAPTYHAFEQLVAGCTLKPINKKDFDAPPKVLEPNKYGRKPDAKLEVGCGKTGSSSGGRKVGRKMRGGEFTTLWHRAKGLGDRVGLLQRVAESDRELTHQQQLYEQINEFQRWPDPDAAQCESVSFELEGYDAAELQIPPGTAVGEGPIVVKFPDLLATIEDFAKVTGSSTAGRFTNTTVSFRRRHRAYHNLRALARASEVLGGRSGRGNSQQLRVRLRAPRETVSHPPLQVSGRQVSGARQAEELQLDLAELGLHPKRPGEEDGVGDDGGGYRLMKARRLGRFENAFVKDPKLAELITDNSDLATGVFNLTSGEKHEDAAQSKISNGVTIAASMTNQFVRYRWGAVNGGSDDGSDRVFPSEKAEQIFRQQFWELSETVLNSKREEILWAWEVLYDETVQSGERALYTDTTQVSVPHYSAAGQLPPALRPPGGERQPEEPSFYHRVVTRYPFYSALDRAEQATLDGIRKNLKHAEESYFPAPPVAHFGYRADRERHSFASFSDRLEAGKLREGLYKYTSMGALHPFFLVIEGLLQRFQKVLSQKCFPAVLLLAAVFYYDKFLETNGDIWCAIHEAQKKFVEIQQGMQRFDLLAQVIGLKVQDELEARVKAATGVQQPLGATQTQTLHRRHLYDGVMQSCMLPVSSKNAGGGQQEPVPPAGVSDAFEAIRRFTSDAFQSMHESQAAGNEMFALEMSHEHTLSPAVAWDLQLLPCT
eukprot:g12619.t1